MVKKNNDLLRSYFCLYYTFANQSFKNNFSLFEVVDEDLPPDDQDVVSRGPRIKHVCRRAAVVLGLPRATFADVAEPKESFNLSALPQEEKQKILETVPTEEKPKDSAEPGT